MRSWNTLCLDPLVVKKMGYFASGNRKKRKCVTRWYKQYSRDAIVKVVSPQEGNERLTVKCAIQWVRLLCALFRIVEPLYAN